LNAIDAFDKFPSVKRWRNESFFDISIYQSLNDIAYYSDREYVWLWPPDSHNQFIATFVFDLSPSVAMLGL
jgi:hypothetical protein